MGAAVVAVQQAVVRAAADLIKVPSAGGEAVVVAQEAEVLGTVMEVATAAVGAREVKVVVRVTETCMQDRGVAVAAMMIPLQR